MIIFLSYTVKVLADAGRNHGYAEFQEECHYYHHCSLYSSSQPIISDSGWLFFMISFNFSPPEKFPKNFLQPFRFALSKSVLV